MSDFDTAEFFEAVQANPDLKDDYASDMEDLRAAAEEMGAATASLRHLRQEAHEAVMRSLPDYDRLVQDAEQKQAEAKAYIKQLSLKYRPQGGIRFKYGETLFGTKNTTEKLEIDHRCITAQWAEDLSTVYVDGRPLLVQTIDARLLQEAIRREIVDPKELEEAGILRVKRPTPAWLSTSVGSRDS
jgi:hypothetical protein